MRPVLAIITPIALLLSSATALSAEWTRDASISVGSYFSDNICLVQGSSDKEEKAVATVTPRLDVSGEGGRAKTSLQAAVEYNTLGESSLECPDRGAGLNIDNREAWIPQLTFLSEFQAVENLIYFEADAYAAQNPINPFAAGGQDNLNGTGNSNITYQWGVGGRVERQFNQEWSILARYNYNEQYNSFNQLLGDNQEDRFEFDFGKIPGVARLSYGVEGQYSEVTFDETSTQPEFVNRLSRAQVRTAFQLTRVWQVNAYAGQEDNVFVSDSEEIDGTYWDLGMQWTPHSRVAVNIGTGERFFGNTPRFDVSYSHKRSLLRAGYNKDFRFPRNIRASDSGVAPADPFAPGLGDAGDPLATGGSPTFVGQSPVLDERFTLAYVFTGRQTTIAITASDSTQTRASDGTKGDFSSAILVVTRQLGRRLSFDVSINWQNNEADEFEIGGFFQDLEALRGGIGVIRSLTNDTSVGVRYRYTDQTSSQAVNTFTEHRVELSLNHSF